MPPASTPSRAERQRAIADRLHSAAIHLLRRVRQEDEAAGLSPARLSALSVIVYAGPLSLGELAGAEQVRPPTMTRLVQALVEAGLVEKESLPEDRRVTRVRATAAGRTLLEEARQRRIALLGSLLAPLAPAELDLLDDGSRLLARIFGAPAR